MSGRLVGPITNLTSLLLTEIVAGPFHHPAPNACQGCVATGALYVHVDTTVNQLLKINNVAFVGCAKE